MSSNQRFKLVTTKNLPHFQALEKLGQGYFEERQTRTLPRQSYIVFVYYN